MEKKIRTYQITNGFDIKVIDHTTTPPSDISARYQNIARDEANRRVDAFIDVYETNDGQLRTVKHENTKDQRSRASLRVLWDIYINDADLR